MWAFGVRRGHNVNHSGLISLLCLNLCWLSDTQQWRSAHSLWRLQPLIEPCTAYNYIWAHGKIAVWCEICRTEIHRCSDGRVWRDEFQVKWVYDKGLDVSFCLCLLNVRFCLFSPPSLLRSSHCFQYVVYMCLSFGAVVNSYSYYVVSAVIKGQPTRAE